MSFFPLVTNLSSGALKTARVNRSGAGTMARMALALLHSGKSVVMVARNAAELAEYRALLTLFSPDRSVQEPPPTRAQWEHDFILVPQHPAGASGRSGWAERMAALYSLNLRRRVQGVLVSLDNFLLRLPPVDIFQSHELILTKGMDMAPDLVLDQAVDWGFTRTAMVNSPGDIAMRGDILDMFCPGYQKPLRLEFFGDTLEDIRVFDPISQRSLADMNELRLLPVSPVITSKNLRAEAESFWKEEVKADRLSPADAAGLVRTTEEGGKGLFSGVFYRHASTLEDWLPKNAAYLLPGKNETLLALEEAERGWAGRLDDEAGIKGFRQQRFRVLRPIREVEVLLEDAHRVYFEDLRVEAPGEVGDAQALPERIFHSFQEVFPRPEAQERPWHQLVSLMRLWSQDSGKGRPGRKAPHAEAGAETVSGSLEGGFEDFLIRGQGRLVLSFSSDRARTRFLKLAREDGITPKLRFSPEETGVFALISPFRRGMYQEWDSTLILGEDVLQPRVERARRLPHEAFQGLDSYDGLAEGDFLVHRDYGIAAFGGLHRMDFGGIANDYLLLRYAGDDKLYLPVDRLSLVQRFKGLDGNKPAPDKLGGSLWTAGKEKARKAIEKIAADLVEMYALRKVVKGFRYTPVNEMYREFEASFGFEETPDQAKAIEDVLADMEKPEPMDRLVCGDVGFGKTEVALRAAFRAALEGRQAVLLCPTTVLAEQHYQTFRSRLAGFPVNVGMLSRFVSRQKQKEVLEAVSKAQVDILIGTHRLLSKDVSVPNLGLLILDEEQRFGVRHKERMKEMRKNVDVLTLTATPIPRTLQLSLSGIRELSIIETPPPERKPVATALIDRDEATLKGIVERELARQGQVFWVYNRVQGLERVAEYVKKLVPQARIAIAHGQMAETALEKAMHDFWLGDLDILVCTSIIESGLDFPRANTLIVDQAQLFGLGQLYQLRGRVGRSDRQAFAVFVTPDPDRLQDAARQRMRIILDLDYLGAGFRVAMEDLRLRGAGNILGESQSGHMNRLGLDLFLEMLEEAVTRLKGEPARVVQETELSLAVPAFIPETYMTDSNDRLRYYKLLSSAASGEAEQDITLEIRDRFGPLPLELENFIAVLSFKRSVSRWNVQKAEIFPDRARLFFAEGTNMDPARLVAFIAERKALGEAVRLLPPATLEMPLRGETLADSLGGVRGQLAGLMHETEHSPPSAGENGQGEANA